MPSDRARRRAWIAFAGVGLGGIVAVLVAGPLPQPASFHDFADRRTWLGVPNAADVLSNVPLLAVAVLAFVALAKRPRGAGSMPSSSSTPPPSSIRAGFLLYATGLAATSVGSAVYHLDPNDSSLVWDRLPLAPTFGAVAGLLLIERLGIRRGGPLLAALTVATVGGALAWAWTLRHSPGGDTRPYHLARTVPVLWALIATAAFPEPRASRPAAFAAFAGFVLASVFEAADRAVFDATGGTISGHTLKHLTAAAAAACLVRWFARTSDASRC